MKKLILLFILSVLMTVQTFAQKTDTTTYKKIRIIEEEDYRLFLQVLSEYKELLMYNPKTDDKQKIDTWKFVDAYGTDLFKRIKLDSIALLPPRKEPLAVSKNNKK